MAGTPSISQMPLIAKPPESNLYQQVPSGMPGGSVLIARAKTLTRKEKLMPDEKTLERAREDEREGKSASTQAGEFVREEMHHIREGKHGARSPQQAIAIGLSKARRAGVKLTPPRKGRASAGTRKKAARDYQKGRSASRSKPSGTRSRAVRGALKREGRSAASPGELSRQAHASARKRGSTSRKQAAQKAARTKGRQGLKQAARKAARTRASNRSTR